MDLVEAVDINNYFLVNSQVATILEALQLMWGEKESHTRRLKPESTLLLLL
jgi:hypothetical protein